MKIQLSKRVEQFDSSDFRRVFQWKEKIHNPVDLSVGTPEEKTRASIKRAAIKAIKQNKTTYTPANGVQELRSALSRKVSRQELIHHKLENITIVPGLTTGQLLVYLAILDPGDEVIIMDPYYPPYYFQAGLAGAKAVPVKTRSDFQLDIPAIKSAINKKTKAILINSPNNPTGAVYSESSIRELIAVCKKHDLILISDEIYDEFTYDRRHFRPGSIYENTITLNGFSKSYAMTGWRIGYVSGPFEVIEAINELQQYIVFATSSIAQYAAVEALNQKVQLSSRYERKRNLLVNKLKDVGVKVYGAQGAYYLFIKTPTDRSDAEFVSDAAKLGLVVVPGRAFSKDQSHIRISYGANLRDVKKGAKMLSQLYERHLK